MIQSAHLTDRSLLRLSGSEVVSFLQNLITCDIENLEVSEAGFGALLSPQGKILFDFFVLREDDNFIFDTATNQRDNLFKRLMFYKLRANVDIELDARQVFVFWQGAEPHGFTDPRHPDLGGRLYSETIPTNAVQNSWEINRIDVGIPQSGIDFELGAVFPHDVLMDQFNNDERSTGIDFSKGCYVGQEVVSRMQHRGTARNRVVKVHCDSHDLPPKSTEISAGGKTIGTLGGAVGQHGLAIVRIDRAASAIQEQIPFESAGYRVQLQKPEYADYAWP